MTGPHYYDIDGTPMAMMEWARKLEARKRDPGGEWRIGHDQVGEAEISTVWLGLDHNWSPAGPPHIFETMIFGGAYNDEQWRYSTKEEAAAGHERIVAALREGREP